MENPEFRNNPENFHPCIPVIGSDQFTRFNHYSDRNDSFL